MLHDLSLVESHNTEPRIQRADCKVIHEFSTVQRVSAPNLHVAQGSTVIFFSFFFSVQEVFNDTF